MPTLQTKPPKIKINDRVSFTLLQGFWKGCTMRGFVTSVAEKAANVKVDKLNQTFKISLKQIVPE